MKTYKAFNKDMTCRGFQYAEGQEYEMEGPIRACERGFHACERAVDVLGYYGARRCVVHEVEQDGILDRDGEGTKIASSKIKIGARLNVAGIVQATFEYNKEHCTEEHTDPKQASAGYRGAASAGYRGAASAGSYGAASAGSYGAASADESGAASAGESGAASAGSYGAASAGYRGAASAGSCGAASAGSYGAASAGESGAASAGYRGAASAGESGAASAGCRGAASAGYRGAAVSRGSAEVGKEGIAAARGNDVKVKGGLGAILVLAEEKKSVSIAAWKAFVIDGETYKADTWYRLKDGEVVEVRRKANEDSL